MERKCGDGQELTAAPTGPACPDDSTHLRSPIPPETVIDTVACSHPDCGAKPGQACDPKAGRHFYEGTKVHRGRWLEFERDVRTGRASFPPR